MKVIVKWALFAVLSVACFVAGVGAGRYADRLRGFIKRPTAATEAPQGLFIKNGGRWHRRRNVRPTGQQDALEKLRSLPYVTGSQSPSQHTGVTVHDSVRAADGDNIYSSAHAPRAFLINAAGHVLHEWHMSRDAVWPELAGIDKDKARQYFRRIRVFENGDLLAIYEYTGIIKLDALSKLLWAHQGWNHHDFDVDKEGRIYVLGRDFDEKGRQGLEIPAKPFVQRRVAGRWVYDENITILSPKGALLEKISLVDCIENSRFAPLLDALGFSHSSEPIDFLHPNTVQILDGNFAHLSPAFNKGNILTSFRDISTIAIIDPKEKKVVWALSHAWRSQHDPVLLANGLMLLFDNYASSLPSNSKEQHSRVIEFDPLTQQATWLYRGTDSNPMFSSLMGAIQRLPNGNTLITESDFGRAIEITRSGEVVWEFKNPHTIGDRNEFVAIIPELLRVPVKFTCEFVNVP